MMRMLAVLFAMCIFTGHAEAFVGPEKQESKLGLLWLRGVIVTCDSLVYYETYIRHSVTIGNRQSALQLVNYDARAEVCAVTDAYGLKAIEIVKGIDAEIVIVRGVAKYFTGGVDRYFVVNLPWYLYRYRRGAK